MYSAQIRSSRPFRQKQIPSSHSTHNMSKGKPDETLQYLWAVNDEWKLLVRYAGKDTTRYIYLHSWDQEPVRLYHVKSDPHEKKEVSKDHPKVVAQLKGEIEKWHPVNP